MGDCVFTNAVSVVSCVSDEKLSLRIVDELLCDGGLMPMTWR
jgi:hypothetical protein